MARFALWASMLAGLALALGRLGPGLLGETVGITTRLGAGGLLAYCVYSIAVFGLVGGAWIAAADESMARLPLFTWARLVREATSDLLPFSQIGGLLVSMRLLVSKGLDAPRICAATIVDLATELASQFVFTILVLASLGSVTANVFQIGQVRIAVLSAAGALAVLVVLFVLAPRGLALASLLVGRVMPSGSVAAARVVEVVRQRYRQRRQVALAFGLNFTAWSASAAGIYFVLRLMHVDLTLGPAVALEALIFLVRSVAFAIPGGVGVQEFGYALLGPLVGLPLEAALALALVKRVRDLLIGVPTLVIWQWLEIRSILSARKACADTVSPKADDGISIRRSLSLASRSSRDRA